MPAAEIAARRSAGERAASRLDMTRALSLVRAPLTWREYGGARRGAHRAAPAAWGDVVLRGKDRPATITWQLFVDDAIQQVSDVVRGRDPLPRHRHSIACCRNCSALRRRATGSPSCARCERGENVKSAALKPLATLANSNSAGRSWRRAGFGGVP